MSKKQIKVLDLDIFNDLWQNLYQFKKTLFEQEFPFSKWSCKGFELTPFSIFEQRSFSISPNSIHITLKKYDSYYDSEADISYINLEGSIWAVSWCPTIHKEQYLAVYSHNKPEMVNSLTQIQYKQGYVQIWKFLEGNCKTDLVILLETKFAPIFLMEWLPDYPQNFSEFNENLLGLLAYAGCDEVIRVACIPFISNDTKKPISMLLEENILLIPSTRSCRDSELRKQYFGRVTCFKWYLKENSIYIGAGYSNGSMCFWSLSLKNFSCKKAEFMYEVYPINIQKCFSGCINTLEFCPHIPFTVLLAGLEQDFCVLNLKDPKGNNLKSAQIKYAQKIIWPKCMNYPLYLFLFSRGFPKNYVSPLKVIKRNKDPKLSLKDNEKSLQVKAPISDICYCDNLGVLVCCTSNGIVLTSKLLCNTKIISKKVKDQCIYHLNFVENMIEKKPEDLINIDLLPKEENMHIKEEHWENSIRENYIKLWKNEYVFYNDRNLTNNIKENNPVIKAANNLDINFLLNPLSINRVTLNPNRHGIGLLASGGNAGFLRIENVVKYFKI